MDSTVTTERSHFYRLLEMFRWCFTSRSYRHFVLIVVGWALGQGQRTLSRIFQAGARFEGYDLRRYGCLYRFFSMAQWSLDRLGAVLVRAILPYLPAGTIFLIVDDTLFRRTGPHLFGAGMHYDALQSTYGRGDKRHVVLSYGHDFVILSVWVPLPWSPLEGLAVPVASVLYRSLKTCTDPTVFKKRTALARELLARVLPWLPADRGVTLLGDDEYTCEEVGKNLPKGVDLVGSMAMNAAVFEPAPPYPGKGRPRKKGKRMLSPKQLAADSCAWQNLTVPLYGRQVSLQIKTQLCLWYHVTGQTLGRMVVTRDPKGRLTDRAIWSTRADQTAAQVVVHYGRRWSAEPMHRETRQVLGVGEAENGSYHREAKDQQGPKRPGPQPHPTKGQKAVERTVPFGLFVYALVVLWYLQQGQPSQDVRRAQQRAPWFNLKSTPSVADMLEALRRDLWSRRLLCDPHEPKGFAKRFLEWFEWIWAP